MRNPICKLCPRYQAAKNVCIYGNALPDSTREIMIIIDKVSNATDQTTKLLDGQPGNVLKKLLESVGILHKVYITPAVKCCASHEPKAAEIKICREYLLTEIKEVRPKLIICLGAIAAKALIGKHIPTKKLRQRFIKTTSGITVAITFSHNSIFVNPNIYNQLERDMFWIINNYRTEKEEFDWTIKLEEQPEESMVYGIDVETEGLNVYTDNLLTVAIGNPNNKVAIGYNIGHKGK